MSKFFTLKRVPLLIKLEYRILMRKYGYAHCIKSLENLNTDSATRYVIKKYLDKIKK